MDTLKHPVPKKVDVWDNVFEKNIYPPIVMQCLITLIVSLRFIFMCPNRYLKLPAADRFAAPKCFVRKELRTLPEQTQVHSKPACQASLDPISWILQRRELLAIIANRVGKRNLKYRTVENVSSRHRSGRFYNFVHT